MIGRTCLACSSSDFFATMTTRHGVSDRETRKELTFFALYFIILIFFEGLQASYINYHLQFQFCCLVFTIWELQQNDVQFSHLL